MITKLDRPYAIVHYFNDSTWNDDFAELFRVETKEELDLLVKSYEEEQPYTGCVWNVYLCRKE